MNLKRIIWICKVVGVYGNYIYKCLDNLPSIDEDKSKFKSRSNSEASRKTEPVRSL